MLYHSIVTQSLPKLLVGVIAIDDPPYLAQLHSLLVRIEEIEQEIKRRFTVRVADPQLVSQETPEATGLSSNSSDRLVSLDVRALQVLQTDLVNATGTLHRTCKVAKCAPTIHRYLALTHKLHLVSPRNIAMSSESNTNSSDDDFMGSVYREQLRFYFGLWAALRFLAESPKPVFPNLKHLTLGNQRRNRDLEKEFFVSMWQNEVLQGVYVDANEELSSFVRRTELRSVCLYPPRDFVQLGRPVQCLILSQTSVHHGDNSPPALLTLHSRDVVFTQLAGRCYAAGCRIRFVLQPEPRPDNVRRQAQADTPPGTFSDLEEQLREIRLMVGAAKKLPEWEYTDMELVILPVDTAIFAQVQLSNSTTRPVLSAHDWDKWILKEAKASVSSSLAQLGVTSGGKTIRVITSISESPWRDCLCTDELDE